MYDNIFMMKLNITPLAIEQLQKMNKTYCVVQIKKGGCFGYMSSLTFDHTDNDKLITVIDGVSLYISTLLEDIEIDLYIDYKSSLMKSGFVINSLDTSNCCCNKSFGRKLDRTQCSK